jgi:putative transcriptional regulator
MAKTIVNNIRRLRFDRKEMTQQELADKIGVTRQTVNAIELSKYSPSLEVAFKIADVFGGDWRPASHSSRSGRHA